MNAYLTDKYFHIPIFLQECSQTIVGLNKKRNNKIYFIHSNAILPGSESQSFHSLQIIHFSSHFYIDIDINLSLFALLLSSLSKILFLTSIV